MSEYIQMDESRFPHPVIVNPQTGPEQPYHFYVTCVYGYAKGRTLQSAMNKLLRDVIGHQTVNERRNRGQSIQVWAAIVDLPMSYQYRISCYKPCTLAVEWVDTFHAEEWLQD